MLLSVWNSCQIPFDTAFEPEISNSVPMRVFNYMIDLMFLIDIILNFRTTFQSLTTGDEVTDPKEIAINYLKAPRFWIDAVSTIPFDVIMSIFYDSGVSQKFSLLQMLKLFRVLRL